MSCQPPILSLRIPNPDTLRYFLLPFVKPAGVFVPTVRELELKDTICLVLSLADYDRKFAVTGRVVWVTPANAGLDRPQGAGMQFVGADNRLLAAFEEFLSSAPASDEEKPSATL